MQAWSLQTGDQSSSGRADEYIEDALLIDRAAAAEVPRDEAVREWARDKRAFISSIMEVLREERAAAGATEAHGYDRSMHRS